MATWTDSSGNWSNSANWSTLTVPNNGGGKTYDVVINAATDTVTFDASSTSINSLTMGTGVTFQNNGVSQTLTASIINAGGNFTWRNGSLNGSVGSNTNGMVSIANSNLVLGGGIGAFEGGIGLDNCIGTIGGGATGVFANLRIALLAP